MTCVPSEDSDKPGHPPSLIRVFAVHSMAHADLSLCWAHRSFCWFCHAQALMSFVTTASPLTGKSGDHDHNRPAKRMAHALKAQRGPSDGHRSCVLQDISLGDISVISPARHSRSFQKVICPTHYPVGGGMRAVVTNDLYIISQVLVKIMRSVEPPFHS